MLHTLYAVLAEKPLTSHLFKHRIDNGWQSLSLSPCIPTVFLIQQSCAIIMIRWQVLCAHAYKWRKWRPTEAIVLQWLVWSTLYCNMFIHTYSMAFIFPLSSLLVSTRTFSSSLRLAWIHRSIHSMYCKTCLCIYIRLRDLWRRIQPVQPTVVKYQSSKLLIWIWIAHTCSWGYCSWHIRVCSWGYCSWVP